MCKRVSGVVEGGAGAGAGGGGRGKSGEVVNDLRMGG